MLSVIDRYRVYGEYINQFRAIPNVLDGLRPVERRNLVASDEVAKRMVKSVKIVASALILHPHGDCLDGQTKVLTLDGRYRTIKEIHDSKEKDLWILAFDRVKHEYVPAKAHSFRIGQYSSTIYHIQLSNNKIVSVTGNHPLLTRNRGWISAENLVEGDLIEGGTIEKQEYLTLKPIHGIAQPLHKVIEKSVLTHHQNENRWDNRPENLIPTDRAEHCLVHSKPEYRNYLESGQKEMFGENGKYKDQVKLKNSLLMKEFNKKQSEYKAILVIRHLMKNNLPVTEENYSANRKIIYNAPHIKTLLNKNKISEFSDLIEMEKDFKLDTEHCKGLTKIKNIVQHKVYDETYKAYYLERFGMVIETMVNQNHSGQVNLVEYEGFRKMICKTNGLGLGNIQGRMFPKLDTVQRFTKNPLEDLQCNQVLFVKKIEIEKFNLPIPMYDFTVDNLKNMCIITGESDTNIDYIVVHNSSSYGNLTRLVQSNLLIGQGNWGITEGLEPLGPAAMRYTEAQINPIIDTMLFEFIKFVPHEKVEWEIEPLYLPTPIPICFLLDSVNVGIGFSVKSTIPKYKITDLIELLTAILNNQDKHIKPYCKGNVVVDELSQCQELLDTGRGSVVFQAQHSIDQANRCITITGTPINGFGSLERAMEQFYDRGQIYINDLTSERAGCKVIVGIIKSKKCDFNELYNAVLKSITQSVAFDIVMIDDKNQMGTYSVKALMTNYFQRYTNIFQISLQDEINTWQEKVREFELIAKMRPIVSKLIKDDIRDMDVIVNTIYEELEQKYPKTKIQDTIRKYSIEKLFTVKLEIEEFQKKIQENEKLIKNISQETFKKYKAFYNKLGGTS